MKTYIINLPTRKDRFDHITNELKKLEIKDYEVIEAVFDEIGWIGCFKSHLKCIEKAKNEGLKEICILEDDAIFDEDAKEKINEFLINVKNLNWNMLFLGVNHLNSQERIAKNILRIYAAYSAHAYIVNENMYDVILNLATDVPIDIKYCRIMSSYNIYCIDPMCVYQIPSYSDIEKKNVDYKNELIKNYKHYVNGE